MTHRVFVYGTLLSGCHNNRLLNTAKLLEERVKTPGNLTMINLGGYPGIIEGGNTVVKGELYAVDDATLERLDRLEGHPQYYQRKPIIVGTEDELITYNAEAYFLPNLYLQRYKTIEGGSWKDRNK